MPNAVNSVFVCCNKAAGNNARGDVARAIEALGESALIWPCCWYLETAFTVSEVKLGILRAVGSVDPLIVIDATNHEAAWQNISFESAQFIRERWKNGVVPSLPRRAIARSNSRNEPSAE